MRRFHRQSDLAEYIKQRGRFVSESWQIHKRLRTLLPARLKALKLSHAAETGKSRALRQALVDPHYLAYLDEYLELSAVAREARIEYETHLMLYRARQSIQSFYRDL